MVSTELVLEVPDMKGCSGCAVTVRKAVDRLPGIQSVETDPETAQTAVTYAPDEVDEAEIRKAIREVGFHPS